MKTQHWVIVVAAVVGILLFVSLHHRTAQLRRARGPRQAATPTGQQNSSLRKTDAGGSNWSLDLAGGQSLAALAANGAKAGAPILVKTDIQRPADREVSVGLVLEGQAGESYRPVVKKNGTQVATPALRIVNEAGQVVAQGNFSYG